MSGAASEPGLSLFVNTYFNIFLEDIPVHILNNSDKISAPLFHNEAAKQ